MLNSLHRLLNCEIGELDYHVITTRVYILCPLNTHFKHQFWNALVYVICSRVSSQYSHAILPSQRFDSLYFIVQRSDRCNTDIIDSAMVQYISIQVVCVSPGDEPSTVTSGLPMLSGVWSIRTSHRLLNTYQ